MDLTELTLVPFDDGRFNVFINGQQIFSKKQLGRFPEKGEIVKKIQAMG